MSAVLAEDGHLEEARRLLAAWGEACGRISTSHGVARATGLRAIIAHIQRAEADRKRAEAERQRKLKRQASHGESDRPRRQCLDCGYRGRRWGARVDGRWRPGACPECLSCRTRTAEPTALGRESKTPGPLSIQQLSAEVLRVDAIVALLPGWMQQPVRRRYAYRQPDRFAAEDLKVDERVYRARLLAAERRLAEIVARRAR